MAPSLAQKEAAALIITRAFRWLMLYKRTVIFRTLPGWLFCRDYSYNKNSGAFEIMSMHMIYNHIDNKCMHLRFTIFDYATKRFNYIGIFDQLENVNKFNVEIFYKLCRPSI